MKRRNLMTVFAGAVAYPPLAARSRRRCRLSGSSAAGRPASRQRMCLRSTRD